MNPQTDHILDRYYRNECSPEEVRLLMGHFNTDSEQALLDAIMKRFELDKSDVVDDGNDKETLDAVYMKIRQQISRASDHRSSRQVRLWPRIIGVAAAAAAIVFGLWFFTSRYPKGSDATRDLSANDIAPGKHGATITLADGKVIKLSDAKTGVVIGEDLKYNDGTNVNAPSTAKAGSPQKDEGNNMMLTATTSRGQTYQVTLPDGTKVWLNADSKISFPSKFTGKERSIFLDGEGYFEVKKLTRSTLLKGHSPQGGERIPFVVHTDKQDVTVLGTHFNINAYKEEGSVRTTLLEGSVRVATRSASEGAVILKPNQQSLVAPGNDISVQQVNVNDAIDWKNGEFNLVGQPFRTAMRKIARWYDVEVIYDASVPANIKSSGWISRDVKLQTILEGIERSGQAHFKLEGRKLYVSK